jgi:squalene synthase HpnC
LQKRLLSAINRTLETPTLESAYAACTRLAREHYENFPVGRLVPAPLRPHVHAIYAFARTADDIADEDYDRPDPPSESERLDSMHQYQAMLEDCLADREVPESHRWIFLPLADTQKKFELPPSLFRDLLSAFEQDITKRRYADYGEVTDYCRRSANPVGRLLLYLHGFRDSHLHQLSDHICTGLQLANFWQDVSVDLKKDRIYLPEDERQQFGVSEEALLAGRADTSFRQLMEFQVDRAAGLFREGEELPRHLGSVLGWEIRLTWLGGMTILRKIKKQDYDTLSRRPSLKWYDALRLVPYAWISK